MSAGNYLGHAAVYSLTNGLMQVGGLVMLTLYTRLLAPQEYGAFAVLTSLAETVSMVLIMGGFQQAFLTFYQQSQDEQERRRVLTSTYAVFTVAALVGGGLIGLFAGPLCDLFALREPGGDLSGATLLRLAVLSVLIDPFCIVPLVLLQVRLHSRKYLIVSVVRLLGRIGLSLFFLLGLRLGVGGALLATVLCNTLFAVLLGWQELRQGLARPERERISEMIRFALPFLPGSLCFFLLHAGDRLFLTSWGTAEVGLYDLGYKFAQLATPFALAPLVAVWNHRMYEVARTPEAPIVFGRVYTWILAAYLLAGLGVVLFVEEALLVLAHPSYQQASRYTPLILVACALQASASLMDAGFYVRRRTDLKLGVTLTATVVMLAAYAFLIPPLGALGAALATLLGFAALALLTWLVARRIFPVRYEPIRLLAWVGLLVVAWMVGRWLPVGVVTSPLKLLLWGLVPTLAWQLGLISPGEKEYLSDVWKRQRRRWSGQQTDTMPVTLAPRTT